MYWKVTQFVEWQKIMDIAKRFKENPLLRPTDIKPSMPGMEILCLLNPGVFTFMNKTWLLCRVAERQPQKEGTIQVPIFNDHGEIEVLTFNLDDPKLDASDPRIIVYKGVNYLTSLSHLRLLCSENGVVFYEPESYPPLFGRDKLETFGIEDCRVAHLEGRYHLTYTQVSALGVGVGLIQTSDWQHFDRHGMIFPPHNKDCALFEEKINGKYFAFHRPSSPELGGNYLWLAESPDLLHWGNHQCVALTRPGMWDSVRIGAGAAPIKTDKGWLEIYHGANADNRYCLGALLLDLQNPAMVIARSEQPIMEPIMEYEKTGFFGEVIFTNGHVVEGDELTLYYGASDEVICGATLSISQIIDSLDL